MSDPTVDGRGSDAPASGPEPACETGQQPTSYIDAIVAVLRDAPSGGMDEAAISTAISSRWPGVWPLGPFGVLLEAPGYLRHEHSWRVEGDDDYEPFHLVCEDCGEDQGGPFEVEQTGGPNEVDG